MCLKTGAGNRNRTYDLIITNDALYQLSYSGAARILGKLAPNGQRQSRFRQKKLLQ